MSLLQQQQFPVVPGVVIPAQWLKRTLASIEWSDPLLVDLPNSSLHLDLDNALQLQTIAQQIRRSLAQVTFADHGYTELADAVNQWTTPMVILRPSLIVKPEPAQVKTFVQPEPVFKSSGLLKSRVCRSDRVSIAMALKQLWGDLFGAKSLFYWQHLGIRLYQINLAVIVQPIAPAIAAGTVRRDGTHLEICATVGLGHALSRGEVTPDRYRVDLATGAIATQELGEKNVAYQLADSTHGPNPANHASSPLVDGVAPYVPAHTHKTQYSLTEPDLHRLIQRSQQIVAKLGPQVELEWVLNAAPPDAARPEGDRLQFTQAIFSWPTIRVNVPLAELSPTPATPAAPVGQTPPPGAVLLDQGLSVSPGQVTAQAQVISLADPMPETLTTGTVLVADSLPLNWLPLLSQATALITQKGGLTSHSAIVARELGIPAVMGLPNAMHQIHTGDWLWLDGDRGTVYRLSTPPSRSRPQHPIASPRLRPPASDPSGLPAIRTQLMVNVHQLAQASQLASLPIVGIGLIRSELLAMTVLERQHPTLWLQSARRSEFVGRWAAAIAHFAQALPNQPVFYRSFDLRHHEFQPPDASQPTDAAHAVLGVRGTFSYQLSPDLFNLELAALAAVQAAGQTNVHLILPFVRTVEEFQFCRQLVKQAGLMAHEQFQLWIMAEVPSVLLLLPDYVEAGVQGISIGTNDLTQLLLGVDRDEATMAIAFEERHPAVQRAIAQLIQQATALGIPCAICGDAPVRHRELIQNLVRWGIGGISVPPEMVEEMYWEIVRAEHNLIPGTARS